jgi:aspartyl-tRNA(Asn)/glutamyl-tRNA(Gln) amidotransferase subunit A
MLDNISLKQASLMLKNNEMSSVELTKAIFKRINEKENDINAFITLDEEAALRTAKAVDDKRSKGEYLSTIAGIPVAVKDNMATQSLLTTAGSKILSNFIPPYDATVIRKLKEKNSVIIGKANMDEFAMGSSTESSFFGITRNPHDLTRVPGGSSGGSAAAVASDMAIYALGSDTGGSIRQPASFCGIVGLKPTYGRVSRYGLFSMGSSLDQIGPLTKTVEDAAIVLENIAGWDQLDSTSVKRDVPLYSEHLNKSIKGLKVGLPKEYFEGVNKEISSSIEQAVNVLKSQGAEIIDISLPFSKYALAVYYIIMPSEVSANLARYDGVKYGRSAKDAKDLLETYLESRREGFGAEAKRRIMIGTYALSAGYRDAYYIKAQKVRTLVKNDFEQAFEKVDVLVTPTSPILPFKLGEKITDPLSMYLADVDTVPANIAGVPAISVPITPVSGLPVGMQIVGNYWSEELILNVAHQYEKSK